MKKFLLLIFVVFQIFVVTATAQMLDESPTRVQTTLNPGFKRIGTVKPRSVHEIETQNWRLGCETLDRDLTDYESYKDYLVPLGIKEIRLQGGWAKCERVKGEYDFAWLDKIINDALERGLTICLETSYGNKIYPNSGNLGPSGPLPSGEETLAAWDCWVEALAVHFKDRVKKWSMWNEPNLKYIHGQVDDPKTNSPQKTAEFNIRTAEMIKRIIPEAQIGGLVLCNRDIKYIEQYLQFLQGQGKLDLFDSIIFHTYGTNPDKETEQCLKVRPVVERFSKTINLWQGEAGAPSEEVAYALKGISWSELTQAKWNARRMLGDLRLGIWSSVFTISDISYKGVNIQRYGLLKTNKERQIVKVKITYYTVQNIVSIFDGTLELIDYYFANDVICSKKLMVHGYRNKNTKASLLVYWDKTDIPRDTNETVSSEITATDMIFKEPVWVDTITGAVYEIPKEKIVVGENKTIFHEMPTYDAPTIIAEKSLIPMTTP
jgi:hypothetical protein